MKNNVIEINNVDLKNKPNFESYFLQLKVYYALFSIVIYSNEVLAAAWSIDSDVGLRNQYDTNRSLTTASHDSVSGVSLIPRIDVSRETETSRNRITARLLSTRYSDKNVKDTDVQFLAADYLTKGLRNSFRIKADYQRDTTLVTLNDIESGDDTSDLGDPSDSDLGLTRTRVVRNNVRITPEWSFKMSETYSLGLKYAYRKRDFSGDTSSGLVGFDTNTYNLNLAKILDEKSTVSYDVGFSKFDPADDTKSENSSIGISYVHKFTELSNVQFVVGLRDTESPSGNTDGSVYKLSFVDRAEISNINVEFSQDIDSSSVGNVVEKNQLNVRYRRRFTQLSSLIIRARAFKSKSVEDNAASDRNFMSIEPMLRFKLSKNYDADFSYRYRYQKFDNADQSTDSNSIFVGIVYSFDKLNI